MGAPTETSLENVNFFAIGLITVFDAILTSRQTRLEITVFVCKSDVKQFLIRPIIPIRSTGTMWPNYLETELVEAVFKFKNEMKTSSSCAPLDSVISHCCFSEEGKEIDQNS